MMHLIIFVIFGYIALYALTIESRALVAASRGIGAASYSRYCASWALVAIVVIAFTHTV